ncbi:protein DpdD [Massilia sp. 2TAF26]|uniref:protein DpdD n=1 Tax=Massilia sp. 2TAF26 TaxID=3233012 RepID=UPI003F96A16C
MQGIPTPERAWLEHFFAAPNALRWEALVNRSAAPAWLAQVTPWIDLFIQRQGQVPIVLPMFDEHGPCMWYAAAVDPHVAVALGEELNGFIGPSYSDFRGHPHPIDLNDPIEAALHARFGPHVYRIMPQHESARANMTRALSLYLGLLRRRPAIQDRTQQPFGKLRADFDRALLAGNELVASQLLEAMCASGRVNAEQRKFLEIRWFAGLGRQQELAHNATLLKAVMDLSLPPQTIADLVDALYVTFVAGVEEQAPREVAAVFQRHIGQHFGALFKERKGVRQPNVLKAFFLYEATREVPNPSRIQQIEAAYPDDPQGRRLFQHWAEQLLRAAKTQVVEDRAAAASQAIADDDYETAAQLYLQMLPELAAYSGLLRCVGELDDPVLTAQVREVLGAIPAPIVEQLGTRDRKRLAGLQGPAPSPVAPTSAPGWLEWAQDVASHRYAGKDILVLMDAVARWPIEDYVHEATKCADLVSVVGNADSKASMVFRDAFPQFVDFFVNRPPSPVRGFIPLYAMLIKMVAWNGGASADELELVAALLLSMSGAVPDKTTYVDTLDDLGEILNANRAATNIDWAINVAELLAIYPAPDQEARLRFFAAALDLVRANSHRISVAQRRVLQLLAQDYQCEDLLAGLPEPTTAVETQLAAFTGLIAIYSLTEPAAQRARDVLRSLLPHAHIELSADTVATDRLRHLSSKADVFVFAWRSSKHQAYFCVKEYRAGRPLSMPPGKGAASIVQAALAAIEEARLH